MKDRIPRLRMFAGPNGSGKTTVKKNLGKPDEWFGIYINPDDLERTIRESGVVSLEPFGLTATTEEVRNYFANSRFLQSQEPDADYSSITCRIGNIDFTGLTFTAYHASVLADFLRRRALDSLRTFSFETVMSAPDKVDLLRDAQSRGFRTYLYFIATEDPDINVERVKNRVAEGGHDVPEQKIRERYSRSLRLLNEAIPYTNRAYFFDTSEAKPWYFAEATEGTQLELKSNEMPGWFWEVWEHFGTDSAEQL